MAGASMNDIKARIKSVESTMQITKAMELVATSKLRRAKERVERSRPFSDILCKAISDIKRSSLIKGTEWFDENRSGKTLYIVIAGDRGLAGGYNANIFRLTEALSKDKNAIFLPIGKKSTEYFKHRKREVFSKYDLFTQDLGVSDAFGLANEIAEAYLKGGIARITIVYTRFQSMISQLPVYEELLPFSTDVDNSEANEYDPIFEEEPAELLAKIIPEYIGGVIYSAVCESLASESGARRCAMNAANKNASEMIETLMLKFNRARQAVITQEITEIVSGAEAL